MNYEDIVDQKEVEQVFTELKKIQGNEKCIDCNAKKPTWASVNLGLFICMDCAGKHRQYTVKYSFVRSVTLDSWNRRQLLFMQNGGNQKAIQYFQKVGVNLQNVDYKSNAVQKYRNDLENKINQITNQQSEIQQKYTEQPVFEQQQQQPQQQNEEEIMEPQKITNFKVQFSKNSQQQNKGKVIGKKIDDIDFNNLQQENEIQEIKKEIIKQPVKTQQQLESNTFQFDKKVFFQLSKQNVKSISSQSFQNQDNQQEKMNYQNFGNCKSISSNQYFGDNETQVQSMLKGIKQQIQNLVSNAQETIGNLSSKTTSYLNSLTLNWKK